MCKNKSFFDKISEISSKEDASIYQFDKKNLIQESVISFSFESIYKNINAFTNMKYSKNIIFQEKTLSFLNKLINKNSSIKNINSGFLSSSHSNINKIMNEESKIIKKETLSLSGSNSSFRKYKELFNINDKNIFQISIEKSGLKSELFENNISNEKLNHNQTIKKKIKHKNNKSNIKIKGLKTNILDIKSKDREKFNQLKLSPRKKRKKRHSIDINQLKNIKLEDSSNYDSNINYNYNNSDINIIQKNKQKNIKIEKAYSVKENKKKIKKNRNSQFYNAKKLEDFYGDIKNDNMTRKSITKVKGNKRKSEINKLSPRKDIHMKKTTNKSFIDKGNFHNSFDYFAKEEKNDECLVI